MGLSVGVSESEGEEAEEGHQGEMAVEGGQREVADERGGGNPDVVDGDGRAGALEMAVEEGVLDAFGASGGEEIDGGVREKVVEEGCAGPPPPAAASRR